MPPANSAIIHHKERLRALMRTGLLDSPSRKVFDRFTDLVRHILKTPVSLITLVDANRQFFLSANGLKEPYASQRETPLNYSFCQHTVVAGEPFVVEDARKHPLVHDNLAIDKLGVVAYLGTPVQSHGHMIGTLCAIDHQPYAWTNTDIKTLEKLRDMLVHEIERWQYISPQLSTDAGKFYSDILEQIPSPVTIYDVETQTMIYSNHKLERLYGYPGMDDETITLERMQSLIHPDDRIQLEGRVQTEQSISQPDIAFDMATYRVRHHNGHWLHIETYSTVFKTNANGKPRQLLSIVLDVTEQTTNRDHAVQLAIQNELLTLVRDLAMKISHDIRTPLASIQLNLDMIDYRPETEMILKRVAAIKRQVKHLTHIMNDLSTFDALHRMDDFTPETYNVTALVSQAAQVKWLNLQTRYDRLMRYEFEGDLPQIVADRQKLQIAITNLIENAVFYSEDGDTITVGMHIADDMVEITVQDEGIGIAPEHHEKVFEPFYKVNEARTISGSKTGMGLTLVKRIMALHDGEVKLDSTPGEGTKVTLRLPVADSA